MAGPASAVALVPDSGRGFITNIKDGSRHNIPILKTNAVLGTVHVGDEPVGICYDLPSKRLYVACRGGHTVVPLAAPMSIRRAAKPAPPSIWAGNPVRWSWMEQSTLYVTIERLPPKSRLIDTKGSTLLAKWPIGRDRGPGALEGLSIDPKTNRLFIGDRGMARAGPFRSSTDIRRLPKSRLPPSVS